MSPSYCPVKNGVVERHFRTVKFQAAKVWEKALGAGKTQMPREYEDLAELRRTMKAFYTAFNAHHRQSRKKGMTPNAMEAALRQANKSFPRTGKVDVAYKKGLTRQQKEQAAEMKKYIEEAIRTWQQENPPDATPSASASGTNALAHQAKASPSPAPAPAAELSLISMSQFGSGPGEVELRRSKNSGGTPAPAGGLSADAAGALSSLAEGLRIVSANQVRLAEAFGEVRKEITEGKAEVTYALSKMSEKLDDVTHKLEALERAYKPRKRKRHTKNIPRTPFTAEMMQACVHLVENHALSVVHMRNCLAVLTAASTGCRINEIRELSHQRMGMLIEMEVLEIEATKQKKMLVKAIPERHADMLQMVYERLKFTYECAGIRMSPDDPVFVSSRTRKAMSKTVFIKEINRFLKLAHEQNPDVFEGYIRSHSARIGFATRILSATQNLVIVKEALGHDDIRSTLKYARVSKSEIKDALENASQLPTKPRRK